MSIKSITTLVNAKTGSLDLTARKKLTSAFHLLALTVE